jgi:predicted ATPase
VLCFEDLHWADAAFLSFLEHLADWSESVPLLLLCTARPELHEQRPSWAAGLRNATTINLAPLSEEDTARLLSLLLEQAVLPVEAQRALLDRTGGNPLYAEEYVRLLADRDVLAGKLEEVPFPDSVQALIAARLDTLSQERKSLLQDAAVIGKVFWAGALGEMGARDAREVEQDLHELARKELVRPARTSSMEGSRNTASGTRWSETSATARFHVHPVLPAIAAPRPGSSAKRESEPRTWQTCSPTTTCRRSSSLAQPGT